MIQVLVNSTAQKVVFESLTVKQNLTQQVDTCSFSVKKYGDRTFIPVFNDDVVIKDGDATVFAGKVLTVGQSPLSTADGVVYDVSCVDHIYEADKKLIVRVFNNQTVKEIIDTIISDINTALGTSFTTNNVNSNFPITKIVFNQVPFSTCIKRLASLLQYDWYIDEDKDVHFFGRETNAAPFDLTDTNGNLIKKTLDISIDGSQVVNVVKVRGGLYDGEVFTDIISVIGDDTKSFNLPYRFANLVIEVDTGGGFIGQNVGIDNIDDFTTDDVLYNYQAQMIRFENALADGNQIRFSGNPKVGVFAIAQDGLSVAKYGVIEKLISVPDITSNVVARKRANAELLTYAETIVNAKFKTYTPGLRTGMLLNVQSDQLDTDEDLVIKSITFKPLDPENFGYQIDCISTKKLDLIDILQKLLTPDQLDSDEAQAAEDIFPITEYVGVNDLWSKINPYIPEEELLSQDEWLLDPFDPGDIEWVWGYYFPTSDSDPKRMGRWNREAKWQ